MKHLLTCALIALVAAARAALPTSGLPSGEAPVVIHFALDAAAKTAVGKVALEEADKALAKDAGGAKLSERLGIRVANLRDLTVIANPQPDGNGNRVVALVRGNFDKAKIEAFAASKGVPYKTVSGFKAWEADRLFKAVADDASPDNSISSDEGYLIVADDTTLLAADDSMLLAAAEALKANKAWSHPGLAAGLAGVTNGWFGISADVAAMEAREVAANPAARASGAKSVNIAFGEKGADAQLRVLAQFVSEQKATEQITQLKGLLGFGQISLMPADQDSPEDARKKADLLGLVQRIKIEQDGDKGTFSVDYPAAKVVENVREMIADAAKDAVDLGTGR